MLGDRIRLRFKVTWHTALTGEPFPLERKNNLTAVLGQSNSFSLNMMHNNSVSANWPNMVCFKQARNVYSASEKTA